MKYTIVPLYGKTAYMYLGQFGETGVLPKAEDVGDIPARRHPYKCQQSVRHLDTICTDNTESTVNQHHDS